MKVVAYRAANDCWVLAVFETKDVYCVSCALDIIFGTNRA